MSPAEIKQLRTRLNLDQTRFGGILGVDSRTVSRWETGQARPTGSAAAVLTGLTASLRKEGPVADQIAGFVVGAAAIGGLAFLLMKLFDLVSDSADT